MSVEPPEPTEDRSALGTGENRYLTSVEPGRAIVCRVGPGGDFVDASGLEAFGGFERGDLQGRGWLDAVHEADRDRVLADWRRIGTGTQAGALECHVRRRDGASRRVQAQAVPVFGDGGTVAEWIVTITDTDDRTLADQSSDAASVSLASMAESLPDGLVVFDQGGTIRSFNQAAAQMFGYASHEVIGRNVDLLLPPIGRQDLADIPGLDTHVPQAHLIGTSRAAFGLRKDGSTIPVELHVGTWGAGDTRLYTASFRDLTRQRQTEARLEELQEELQHLSQLSTLGEMASTLAHEINQPLTAISNYLKGVRRVLDRDGDSVSDTVRMAVDQAADQALRAGEVIRHLRAFAARGEHERTTESMRRLIEQAGATLLPGCRDRGIELRLDLQDDPMLVVVNLGQIRQVLLNLVRNAMEAMTDGSRRILTIAARIQPERSMVEVSIDDTGPGIAQPVLDRLFQPFNTTKPDQMGVGLSICRTIVERHGGEISVDSHEPDGTTIRFSLRTVTAEDPSKTE